MFDILIRGGEVIDGSGARRCRADVAIRGDRIVQLGELPGAEARQTIDAAGRIVAPGFVDVHTHSDGWMLKTPHLLPKTRQGFTTEVLMADGISYAPCDSHTAQQWLFYLRSLDGLRLDEYRGWRSIGQFMDEIAGRNVQNAIPHVPYANVRAVACGFGSRRVDDFQMRQMRAEIRRGMEQGAVGLSTGLDYISQCFSPTEELIAACRVVAEYDGLYVTHVRYKNNLLPALKEAVAIGRESGCRVHISHLKAHSPQDIEKVLSYIDQTARHEVDFSFDVYPYQPGSTMLNFLLPYEVWEDGPLAAMGRMADPTLRARFRAGLDCYRVDLDHIHIAWVAGKDNAAHQGKLLSEYVAEMNLPPEEALFNLLLEERLAVLLVFNEGDDALVRPFLQHDLYMMGTDGIYHPEGVIHPRMYGSTGRLLGPCVRDLRLFSLEEAVRKCSGWPAERFGLHQRGLIREGYFADLVIFDPDSVCDAATYRDPHQHTRGIDDVLVNGVPILRRGEACLPGGAPTDAAVGDAMLPGRRLLYRR